MLFDFGVWLGGVFLFLPVLVVGLAWANLSSFYRSEIPRRQRRFYLIALTASSVSMVSYLGYWGWRVCQMYNVAIPLSALLALDRAVAASKLLSIVAVGCFLLARGPYRFLLVLACLWVAFQLWVHGSVIHWA